MHKSRFIASFIIFVAGFVLSTAIDGRHLASLTKGTLSSPAMPAVTAQTAPPPSTPQSWEYRVVTKYIHRDKGDIDIQLNQLGAQGFEIFSVTESHADVGFYLTIVLRRPKQ
jgi:hypothetical protein